MTKTFTKTIGALAPTLLGVGASLRLTRFITTDTLADWLFVGKAKDWGGDHDHERLVELQAFHVKHCKRAEHSVCGIEEWGTEALTWQGRLVSGLDCPFCAGFWITLGVLPVAAWAMSGKTVPKRLAKTVLAGLAVNYLTGHISARIDG